MSDLDDQLLVAKLIHEDACIRTHGNFSFVITGETPERVDQGYISFNPTSAETTVALMEKLELTVGPCMYEQHKKGSCCGKRYTACNIFSDNLQEGIADTIPEAVYNVSIKIAKEAL